MAKVTIIILIQLPEEKHIKRIMVNVLYIPCKEKRKLEETEKGDAK